MIEKPAEDRSDLDIARRQESRAYNELEYRAQQAKEQKSQLDTLLEYRGECMEGLAKARDTGLTPVHVREYQLLMTHINAVVEVIEYKVNASQDNLDRAREVWQKKNEHFEKVKEAVKKGTPRLDDVIYDDDEEPPNESAIIVKKYYGNSDHQR